MIETIHYGWWFGLAFLMLAIVAISAFDFLLWLGIAGVITGIISLVWPDMDWKIQLAYFSVFSLITLILWWKFWRNPVVTDKPNLNQRGAHYVGRLFTTHEAIVNGVGKIHVDDTMWKVRCDDCEAGTKIKVVGVEGTILLAELT